MQFLPFFYCRKGNWMASHRIPRELQNEDHWIKNLTFGDSAALVIICLLGVGIIKIANGMGFLLPGILIAVLEIVLLSTLVLMPIPKEYYSVGGGLRLWKLLLRMLLRRRKRIVYVSNYEKERD